MKKIILFLTLFASMSKGQSTYGLTLYNHAGADLTSGKRCGLNGFDGYVMAASCPVQTSSKNFFVDRVEASGIPTGSAHEFENSYEIFYNPSNCGGTPSTQVDSISGISIIETNYGSADYALAGAFEKGAFFITLDVSGNVVDRMYYPFPSGATMALKPLIVESVNTPGEYYIVGCYNIIGLIRTYFIRVDATGNVLASRNGNILTGVGLVPLDMIMSPYQNELIVVGKAHDFSSTPSYVNKGFLARLNETNLTIVQCRIFGQAINPQQPTADDYFTCVAVNNTQVGGSKGFVMAGYSNQSTNHPLWTVKVDPNGNNFLWSNVYQPFYDNSNTLQAADIVERYSTIYNHNYYIACSSSAGLIVTRLDSLGDWFLVPSTPVDDKNEFLYSAGGSPGFATDISFNNDPLAFDEGFQAFGDENGGTNQYFVNAAFNGQIDLAGCSPSNTTSTINKLSGPSNSQTVAVYTQSGLQDCNIFSVNVNGVTTTHNPLCPQFASAINYYSFLRPTALNSSTEDRFLFQIYPNPSSGVLNITLKGMRARDLHLSLRNQLGQILSDIKLPDNPDQNNSEINLEKLNLKSGIYFLEASYQGRKTVEKLIYLGE